MTALRKVADHFREERWTYLAFMEVIAYVAILQRISGSSTLDTLTVKVLLSIVVGALFLLTAYKMLKENQ